jgi:hypothetical protein
MAEGGWEAAHSVDTAAGLDFAWNYMSNVDNWDDPPAQVILDGPFIDGSLGTTQCPGSRRNTGFYVTWFR